MAANPSGAPISEDQAAQQIGSLLAEDPEYAEGQPEEEPKAPVKAEEPEAEEAEEAEEPEAASEEEEQPEKDSETTEIDPDEKWIEVEETLADGEKETRTYSLNELKAQRMMQADYTRKTEELSRQRKELNEQLRQGIEKEQKQYLETLQTQQRLIMEMIAPELQNLDQLAEEDPAEYVRAQSKVNKINQVIRNIQAEQQRVEQQNAEYLQQEVIPKELEKLKVAIPNWGQETREAIVKTGQDYGFTPDELNGIIDSRMIKVLHDAHQYQALQSKKPVAVKKVAEKPKVMKPGTRVKQDASGDALKKLKKSGRYEDAADAIAGMLGDL